MECPIIPIISLSEFSNRLIDKIANQRIPVDGSIEITARCNLKCVHCYINLPALDIEAKNKELSYKEICNILDQIVDEGCLWLLITGGEPLLRHDFLDIYTYAKKKGLLITLFTNGTLLTPYIADYLSDLPPHSIEITLYGLTQETYENVTGINGSHKRCMYGIDLLLERKLPLKLKTMVMTINKHEIWDIKKFAGDLGIDFRFDPVLNLRIDGDRKPANFRILPDEIVALDLVDEKRMEKWQKFCEKFLGISFNSDYLYQCGAGLQTFHIDSYGQLSVCMMSRVPSYDLLRGSFKEAWYSFIPDVLSKKWSQDTPCRSCNLIALCGQCAGLAQIEHGDPERPVDYLCRIAHLRAEKFRLINV